MDGFYIVAEKPESAAAFAGFARAAGKTSVVLLPGISPEGFENCGADRVVHFKGQSERPEDYAKALASWLISKDAELLLVESTLSGRELAAHIAGILDSAMASDVSRLSYENGVFTAVRSTFGGAAVRTEELSGFCVVTAAGNLFEPAAGKAEMLELEAACDGRVRLVSREALPKTGVDLSKAEKVVCVGLGFQKQEDLHLARELADALGAEVACSRCVAEERHWFPVTQYIGISGNIIRPKLYLSLGVSGQVQHVYGIRDAGVIAAVDINESAPIFKACDYGVVGDLYELVPALIARIKNG